MGMNKLHQVQFLALFTIDPFFLAVPLISVFEGPEKS